MPAMIACGRRWVIGTDDLVIPGVLSIVIRSLVAVAQIVALIAYRRELSCPDIYQLTIFFYIVMSLSVFVILLEVVIVFFSSRGTIANPKPRWPVVYLLYFRLVIFLVEAILVIVATTLAFIDQIKSTNDECGKLVEPSKAFQGIMVILCMFLLLLFVGVAVYLDPCRCHRTQMNMGDDVPTEDLIIKQHVSDEGLRRWQKQRNSYHAVWERRFRFVLRSLKLENEHQHVYNDIAFIFNSVFCDVNVVASDIIAGLILLQRHQRIEEAERRRDWNNLTNEGDVRCIFPKYSDVTDYFSEPLDFTKPEDSEQFQESMYYLTYAMSIYSWMGYLYMGERCSACRLCCHVTRNGCCRQSRRSNVSNDNSCYCGLLGIRRLINIEEEDIVYCSFENSLYQIPFYVVLDHQKEAVVIVFRGTTTLYDIVTDLIGTAEPMPINQSQSQSHFAHKGILNCALVLKERLCNDNILDDAFRRAPNYKLRLVGHSLGGGAAALLGILLKEDYPDLEVFTYGPPGSMLDINAAMYTQSFITSVTVGKDLVTRLSIYTSFLLKQDVLRVLAACTKPKCRIFLEGVAEVVAGCCGHRNLFERPDLDNDTESLISTRNDGNSPELCSDSPLSPTNKPLHRVSGYSAPISTPEVYLNEEPLNLPNDDTENEEAHLLSQSAPSTSYACATPLLPPLITSPESSLEIREASPPRNASTSPGSSGSCTPNLPVLRVPLYPPGRVIHIKEVDAHPTCCHANRHLEANWVNNESFQRIIVTPDMVRDHLPHAITNAMKYVWEHNRHLIQSSPSNSSDTLTELIV